MGGPRLPDNISWTVRAGERWAVLGPNGSGKTTLLSLLCGDHPQAFSSDVRLFGKRRGSGETIWDVKRDVGLVSPEFHLYFSEPLTAFRTAATGYFDALADRPTTPEQDALGSENYSNRSKSSRWRTENSPPFRPANNDWSFSHEQS